MTQTETGTQPRLKTERVSMDQVVAFNMRYYRKAARMTQEELGHRIGMTPANVSSAERSADSDRERRRFDAHTIARVAIALGVPIGALFMPPPTDGIDCTYQLDTANGEPPMDMGAVMVLAMPDNDNETGVMDAYRDRLRMQVELYLDDSWAADVARWMREADDLTIRDSRARRLRIRSAELRKLAGELDQMADGITP